MLRKDSTCAWQNPQTLEPLIKLEQGYAGVFLADTELIAVLESVVQEIAAGVTSAINKALAWNEDRPSIKEQVESSDDAARKTTLQEFLLAIGPKCEPRSCSMCVSKMIEHSPFKNIGEIKAEIETLRLPSKSPYAFVRSADGSKL